MLEFYQLLNSELLKQKGTFTRSMVLLSPILATGLSFINLLFRYDYLKGLEVNKDLSSWNLLIIQHHFLWILILPLT